MSIRCVKCGREYDITLFEYDNRIMCDCGHEVLLQSLIEITKKKEDTMSLRTRRLGELYRDILAEVLGKKVSDPRIGMVSILQVDITPDLTSANVMVSLMTDDKEQEENTMEGLNSATHYIERLVGKQLSVRTLPRIKWHLSHGISHSIHIQNILDEIHSKEEPHND